MLQPNRNLKMMGIVVLADDGTIVDDDEVLSVLKDSLLMVLSESQAWHHVKHESTKRLQNTASVENGQLRIMCQDGKLVLFGCNTSPQSFLFLYLTNMLISRSLQGSIIRLDIYLPIMDRQLL